LGNGSGGVITNCFRINQIEVIDAGAGTGRATNNGQIYAYDFSGGNTSGVPTDPTKTYAMFLANDNLGSGAGFTMPLGYGGMIAEALGSLSTIGVSNVFGKVRLQIDTTGNLIFRSIPFTGVSCDNSGMDRKPYMPIYISPKTNFQFQCQAGAAGAESSIFASLLLWPVT
jgi:hypothetical protein